MATPPPYPTNPNPPSDPVPDNADELITVQEFANRYGVDASIVRHWVKKGQVAGSLVGPRMMRVRRRDIVRPSTAPAPQLDCSRVLAAGILTNRDGLEPHVAQAVVDSMADADIHDLIVSEGGRQ